MKPVIAVVDDEEDIAELLKINLEKNGFIVHLFYNGKQLEKYLADEIPDTLLLDLMLPDTDGLELCRKIKSNPRTSKMPVIMVSAKSEETDKIVGLELGADDYVVKPFSPRELIARIKAVMRRFQNSDTDNTLVFGKDLSIDMERHEVKVEEKPVDLTASEYKLLCILAEKPGWVFSREKILNQLWGYEKAVIDRTIDVHITHLREKLGKAGEMIKNVRGVGYKFEP